MLYCDERVCLSVCPHAVTHISRTTCQKLTKFYVHVGCSRVSVLPCWRSGILCTSGFVGDVTFAHNGQQYATQIGRIGKVNHQEAAPDWRPTLDVYDFLVLIVDA